MSGEAREMAGEVADRVMAGRVPCGGVMSPKLSPRLRVGDGGHETSRLLGALDSTPSRRERRTSSLPLREGRRKMWHWPTEERSDGWVWDRGRVWCVTDRGWDTVLDRGMRRTGDDWRTGDGERDRAYFCDEYEHSEWSGE